MEKKPKKTLDNLKNRFWEHRQCERSLAGKNRTIYVVDCLYSNKVLVILLHSTALCRSWANMWWDFAGQVCQRKARKQRFLNGISNWNFILFISAKLWSLLTLLLTSYQVDITPISKAHTSCYCSLPFILLQTTAPLLLLCVHLHLPVGWLLWYFSLSLYMCTIFLHPRKTKRLQPTAFSIYHLFSLFFCCQVFQINTHYLLLPLTLQFLLQSDSALIILIIIKSNDFFSLSYFNLGWAPNPQYYW